MTVFDKSISVTIAVVYNIVAHLITSRCTKELVFEDRVNRSVIYLVVAGVVGIVLSKKIKSEDKYNIKDKILSEGLWYGGLLLLITPLLAVWSADNSTKIVILVVLLGLIVKFTDESEEKK